MAASVEDPEISRALTAVLRAVRRRRGLSARQVAERMDMNLRTYQHYEAGGGSFNFRNLRKFALASDSDLHGLLNAVMLDDPDLAAWTSDNRLVSITLVSLKALSAKVGDRLSEVEPRAMIAVLDQAFAQLEADLMQAPRKSGGAGHGR